MSESITVAVDNWKYDLYVHSTRETLAVGERFALYSRLEPYDPAIEIVYTAEGRLLGDGSREVLTGDVRIDENGYITGLKPGSCTLHITAVSPWGHVIRGSYYDLFVTDGNTATACRR